MAVLGATDKAENASVAGLAIGLSLMLVHILGIHFTGTSVNPALPGPGPFHGRRRAVQRPGILRGSLGRRGPCRDGLP